MDTIKRWGFKQRNREQNVEPLCTKNFKSLNKSSEPRFWSPEEAVCHFDAYFTAFQSTDVHTYDYEYDILSIIGPS